MFIPYTHADGDSDLFVDSNCNRHTVADQYTFANPNTRSRA
jgi:hypothetical protein